ncbi:MAG: hypothetical protein C4329_12585, partial [Chitinophagaceae bacterium]
MSTDEQRTELQLTKNGPIIIKDECIIKHSDGREELIKGNIALCRYGQSSNKPFCDGSHSKIGFE